MIVVTPDAYTRFVGSMYSNSVTTGDWEDYVSRDLVSYIDSHYRTIPEASSRGLAGHSMGGYGALRIAMKHPGIFSSIYLLSPCCLMPSFASRLTPQTVSQVEAVHTDSDFAKAGFFTKVMFASAAAWSPDPQNPPFFLDLPTGGEMERKMIMAKWTANAALTMIDQYIRRLKQLHAIAFDAGLQDPLSASLKVLDHELTEYRIPHTFETYQGTHTSRIAERIETKTLPFFSKNLSFGDAAGIDKSAASPSSPDREGCVRVSIQPKGTPVSTSRRTFLKHTAAGIGLSWKSHERTTELFSTSRDEFSSGQENTSRITVPHTTTIKIDYSKIIHTMAGGAGASWHAIGPTAYWYKDLRISILRAARR